MSSRTACSPAARSSTRSTPATAAAASSRASARSARRWRSTSTPRRRATTGSRCATRTARTRPRGPKTVTLTVNGDEPADHAALDRGVAELPALSRRRRARRGREHDRDHARGRVTSATSTSTRCGSRPRASRATRPRRRRSAAGRACRRSTRATAATGYVGGYQNQGASTTFEVVALADAATEVELGYVNGPNPAPGTKDVSLYVNDQFVKKLALPSTGAWTDYGTFTDTLDAPRGQQRRLDPLRRGRRRQREPRLPRRHAERAGAVRDGDRAGRRVRRRARSTAAAGPRSSTRIPPGYSLADGKLQIEAQEGDIVGGTFTRAQRPAPAGAGRRQLGGEDDALDRRHRRLRPGRARRPRRGHRVGQARRDAQPAGPVGARARPRVGLAEQRAAARRRAAGHHARAVRVRGPAARPLLARRRRDVDRGGRRLRAQRPVDPGIGLAAYNGTGAEVATLRAVHRRRAAARPGDVRAPRRPSRATRCCSTGRGRAPRTGGWPGRARSPARRLHAVHRGRARLAVAHARRSTTRTRSSSTGRWRATTTRACSSASPTRARTRGSRSTMATRSRSTPRTTPTAPPGAVYNFQAADTAARDAVLNPPGEWNSYELVVEGKRIRIYLNGALINDFTSTDPERMATPSFIGLQNHGNGDDVWFRDMQIRTSPRRCCASRRRRRRPTPEGEGGRRQRRDRDRGGGRRGADRRGGAQGGRHRARLG